MAIKDKTNYGRAIEKLNYPPFKMHEPKQINKKENGESL
jgi:hypothetical protein